ncbi:MAG: hypothetical protein H6719_17175 [Sandaracinaceae bacterium]|nr:hypothetical protein [Sandaracinaceae bacterium]
MSWSKVIWFFSNAGPIDIIGPLMLPLGIGLVLYQCNYWYILLKALWRRYRGEPMPRLDAKSQLPVVATVPSLLRNRGELEAIEAAIESLLGNEYPGPMTIAACVDGTNERPELYRELKRWVKGLEITDPHVRVFVAGHHPRRGKGVAIDTGILEVVRRVESGAIPPEHAPVVFFNVDADSELSPGAIELMVHTLLRPSRLTGAPAMVVTSHVAVPKKHYWKGWRHLFSTPGIIALSVAREYAVSLGLGRNNSRLLPHCGASGALYCTWFEVAEAAPKYARFMMKLTVKDWLRWWIGEAPPSFEAQRGSLEPLPEAIAGMGDDTWMTWFAMAARVRPDRSIDFEYPRTPMHAAWRALVTYFARPFRYDHRAKIYTATPTAVKALFKQRIRWNISRIWTVHRWYPGLAFAWTVGLPALLDVVLVTAFHIMIVVGILLMPFMKTPTMWFAVLILVEMAFFVERSLSTIFALFVDGTLRKNARLLLALPTAGIFHFLFNIFTTIVGFFRLVMGFGYNSGFSPERTLILGGSSRIALAYRATRAFKLAVRSAVRGDVPFGLWWFGWQATPWTKNGYAGWDGPPKRPKPPSAPPVVEPVSTPVAHPPMAVPARVSSVVEQRARTSAAPPPY